MISDSQKNQKLGRFHFTIIFHFQVHILCIHISQNTSLTCRQRTSVLSYSKIHTFQIWKCICEVILKIILHSVKP